MTSFPIPRTPLAATIIEVTAKLVAEKGIASATIRNIATQANVLPPQIYKHVGGIDQLLDAAALHLWQNKPQRPTDADDTINGLYQAIEDLISFGLKTLTSTFTSASPVSRASLMYGKFSLMTSRIA
ncbi:helix-turn-helix domain-containing protein [Pseudomonas sp. REB1044]|uniref:TetR/AcrR family transcriptional regulator n=1 Tax=Pseudomonas sp. REB1044 TaxID=2675224 RepID=UPI00315C55DB